MVRVSCFKIDQIPVKQVSEKIPPATPATTTTLLYVQFTNATTP